MRRLAVWLVLLVVFLPASGRAQSSNATIAGSVTDPTGAVVPGAEVTLTELSIGAVAKITTGPDGLFSLPNLQQGSY
jgi:hypothetical protein